MDCVKLNWESICTNGEAIHFARTYACESKYWLLHKHDFHECFLVSEGIGKQLHIDCEVILNPGELYFVSPDQIHGFSGNSDHPLSLYNIAIKSSVVVSFIDRHILPLQVWNNEESYPKHVGLTESNRKAFMNLVSEAEKGFRNEFDAEFFLSGLMRILQAPNTISLNDETPYWLREALHIASTPDNLRIGVKKLTELCRRSQEHMTRTFKKYMGITPSAWINKLRIKHARYLLVSTRMSIMEIALECGFESASHFYNLYRKETGETPRTYRKRSSSIQVGIK